MSSHDHNHTNNPVTVVTSEKRQKFTEEEKRRLVREYEHSGMSQNKFAKQYGINATNFSQWKKRFTKEDKNLPAITNQITLEERYKELEEENERLTGELTTIRKAFGEKLISLELTKTRH